MGGGASPLPGTLGAAPPPLHVGLPSAHATLGGELASLLVHCSTALTHLRLPCRRERAQQSARQRRRRRQWRRRQRAAALGRPACQGGAHLPRSGGPPAGGGLFREGQQLWLTELCACLLKAELWAACCQTAQSPAPAPWRVDWGRGSQMLVSLLRDAVPLSMPAAPPGGPHRSASCRARAWARTPSGRRCCAGRCLRGRPTAAAPALGTCWTCGWSGSTCCGRWGLAEGWGLERGGGGGGGGPFLRPLALLARLAVCFLFRPRPSPPGSC